VESTTDLMTEDEYQKQIIHSKNEEVGIKGGFAEYSAKYL